MNIGSIVLAGGYGSVRSDADGNPIPKVFESIGGMPMCAHPVVRALECGIDDAIVVVNPHSGDRVEVAIRSCPPARHLATFVKQHDRLGTADAVMCALPAARRRGWTHALVLYGDMPLISRGSLFQLLDESRRMGHAAGALLIANRLFDTRLESHARIVRSVDDLAQLVRIIEYRHADRGERAFPMVNAGTGVWDIDFLESSIQDVAAVDDHDGFGAEKYLTKLVEAAYDFGRPVRGVELHRDAHYEALGVNTLDELELVRMLYAQHYRAHATA